MSNNTNTQDTAFDTIKLAKLVKQTYGRNSITRSAKDTVAQFGCVMSANIPTGDSMIIVKALEAQYAALLVSVISANSDYDRSIFNNPSDYLKTFHNNASTPSILFAGLDSQLPEQEPLYLHSINAAITMPSLEHYVSKDAVLECWDTEEDRFNSTCINNAYKPEKQTQGIMESIVLKLRGLSTPAMEGIATIDKDNVGVPTKADRTEITVRKNLMQRDASGNIVKGPTGKPVKYDERSEKITRAPTATGKQEIVRNDKLTALAPTLVNLQLTSQHGNAPTISHNVVMGVKVMCRQVTSSLMTSNICEAVKGSRKIFSFIKWTEGNLKFVKDFIFGVNASKEAAVANRDMKHWIRALQRRKMKNAVANIGGKSLPPTTTVIITKAEAAKIEDITSVSVEDPFTAAKIISKYYMLGFGIYDTAAQTMDIMFDGDTAFNTVSLGAMKGQQQRESDLTKVVDFLRSAGR